MPAKQHNGPVFILMNPQMGENIGACARAMCNFDLTDLRIINPRDGWPNPKAIDMAKNAPHILEQATVYECLSDALHDIKHLYATTVRPRDMIKPVYNVKQTASHIARSIEKSAILFGPERSGLDNESISLASAIITIDVSDQYRSLNLAQATAICAYECFAASHQPHSKDTKSTDLASKQDIAHLINHLEDELSRTHFFQVEEKKSGMMLNLRNIFTRNQLGTQEVQTLRGVIRALSKTNNP